MQRALVRGVPASFPRALAGTPPDPPLDVARARAQHAAYVTALAGLGLEVLAIPTDEECPDCCFVEDIAIVVDDLVILTRPGAPSRRAEVEPVAASLTGRYQLDRLPAPGTLDGGDCLLLGRVLYVGASQRSNDAGRAWLATRLGPRGFSVVAVPLPPGALHLKSVCAPLADDLVLVAEGTLPPSTFGAARVLTAPADEAHAANVVSFAGAALVAAGCPRTEALVAASGLRTVPVDNSELRRADSALTCLSVLLPRTAASPLIGGAGFVIQPG